MTESLGISRGGVLILEECARMAVCDEKGFSSRSDNQSRAVVTENARQGFHYHGSLLFHAHHRH